MLSIKLKFVGGLMLSSIEVPTNVLLISLGALALALVAGIAILRSYYGNKQSTLINKYGADHDPLNRKHEEVSVFERVPTARRAGFAIAIAVVLLVLNWTIYSVQEQYGDLAEVEIPAELVLDPPPTPPTPPAPKLPPPPPPPALVFQVTNKKIDEPKEPVIVPDTVATYDPNNKGIGDPNSKNFLPEPPKPIEIKKENIVKDEPFLVVEQMPRFPGCEDAASTDEQKKACADQKMLLWIYSQIRYPAQALEMGIEGTAVVSFVVSEDGRITDIKIAKRVGGGCEEEALRVIQKMASLPEAWTPGRQRGQAVKVRYSLPIRFKVKK